MLYTEKVVRCYTQITHRKSCEMLYTDYVFNMSCEMSSTHLFKTSSRRLQDVFYVKEDEKLLRRRRTEDVFKTCLEHVSKTSWRQARVICI